MSALWFLSIFAIMWLVVAAFYVTIFSVGPGMGQENKEAVHPPKPAETEQKPEILPHHLPHAA
jgi:hypothetical protein